MDFRRIVSAIIAVAFLFAPIMAQAESLEAVRQQFNAANQEGQGLKAKADEQARIAATLEEQIASMNHQIVTLQAQITNVRGQIAATQATMAVKQEKLNATIKQQYINPAPTSFELAVTSKSVNEIFDKQTYLDKSREFIDDLLAEVKAVKKQLDTLNEDLTRQQTNLDQQRIAKNQLLEQTRGEQARYETLLRENQAARARLSQTMAKLSNNGPLQSKGYVTRGTVIGREGSTGFSTGPHVHFGVYKGGSPVNPNPYLNNGTIGWPLNNFTITQQYGPASWSNPVYSFHDGIDVSAGYGAPVLAACDGNIIVNSFQSGGFGHYIVIDCGNNLWALAAHMQ
jgi:septal ring factor EnvC (AmiA/AmiB activator)